MLTIPTDAISVALLFLFAAMLARGIFRHVAEAQRVRSERASARDHAAMWQRTIDAAMPLLATLVRSVYEDSREASRARWQSFLSDDQEPGPDRDFEDAPGCEVPRVATATSGG